VPNTLPDGRTVREALDAWVAARGELVDAWRRLSQNERLGLMPPPGQE
jgi:hypothetical protein